MKHLNLLIILVFTFVVTANAQKTVLKIGDNPTTIGVSSILELESSNKALLLTRVAIIDEIPSPVNGMIVYDEFNKCVRAFENDAWSDCFNGTIALNPPVPTTTTLLCTTAVSSPVTFDKDVAYTGTATISYTGGNGASYTASTGIASTGVTGLTATLQAGTMANGDGNLVYDITGTATSYGEAKFTINFGGQSCTLIITSCGAYDTSGTFIAFACHNLGVDTTLNPFTYQAGAINGDLYQWGRPTDGHEKRNSAAIATQATNDMATLPVGIIGKFISNFNWWKTVRTDNLWGDGTTAVNPAKGPNDPCPVGFKVPSQSKWGSIFRGGTTSGLKATATANTWTWTGNGYMVGKALYLPATGYRNQFDPGGTPAQVGAIGYYWSSTVQPTFVHSITFNINSVFPGDGFWSGYGNAVRCIAE